MAATIEKKGYRSFGRRSVSLLHKSSRNLIVGVLLLMVLIVVIDVAGRNFLGSNLPGTVELSEYFLVIIGFIGIFQAHYEKGNISVDLLYVRLPERSKRALDLISNILIFVFCLLFFYAGTERFWAAYKCWETNWFGAYVLPVWVFRFVVPIGCFAICVHSMVEILDPEIKTEK